MKIKRFSILLLLITISTLTLIISLRNASAQDYVKWSLPEGAKMRIGKGGIDDLQFSPDGTRLAVAGAIGIWIYDVHMGKELKNSTYSLVIRALFVAYVFRRMV